MQKKLAQKIFKTDASHLSR